ncbi:HSP20-like chaperone [Microthyrium microscopicum]|uniref:HSP20-like chaperone n=1 Tax=Microthyrium microscopicum TaxID=703497 RepID=A0A6A6ULY9_9PEZI|nr:HSP20-like chaperone [Microthyrium microscopicum]
MAPNIRYINQSAPFWDWIATFEDSAAEHPFFNNNNNQNQSGPSGPPPAADASHPQGPPPAGPWGWGGPWGGRRGHGPRWHHHMNAMNLPFHAGPPGQPGAEGEASGSEEAETVRDEKRAGETGDENPADPPEDTPEPPRGGCRGRRGRHGERGERRGHGRGFHGHGGHGGHGHPYARGGWGFPGARGGMGMLSELFGPNQTNDGDWKPEADVFDTEAAYVVHLSVPGVHKEDVGVSWDPEKSELSVAGVVHRPGDEAFIKTLALDERRVGAFERKIRLGTRASPASVDVDGITAKLENGILFVEVPKLNGEFVEIKKVDIE